MQRRYQIPIFALALCLATGPAFAKVQVSGRTDTSFRAAMEPVHAYIMDEDYPEAYRELSELKNLYPGEPELFYLLAYLRARMYPDNQYSHVDTRPPFDQAYVDYLVRVNELDPDFDPSYLDELDDGFYFFNAATKLSSYLGVRAYYEIVDGDFEAARSIFRQARSGGGFPLWMLEYNANILNSCEENAIVFTNGDADTIPGWYLQCVGDSLIAEFIHPARDVWRSTSEQSTLQKVRRQREELENGIRTDVAILNLSLLNTEWYLEHVRDDLGVRFSSEIDQLWDYEVPELLEVSAGPAHPKLSFSVSYEETPAWRPGESDYRVSDKAVIQIIQDNFGRRPIYFAVTCESMIGFEDFCRAEGMVNRLTHNQAETEEQVDIDRLIQNLDQVYQYRTLKDPKTLRIENTRRLMMNYGAGYVKAASYFAIMKDFDRAWAYASKARDFIDEELRMIDFYVRYYAGQAKWSELDDYIERCVYPHQDGPGIYLRYVMQYLDAYDPIIALRYYERALRHYPDEYLVAQFAVYFAEDYGMEAPVANILESLREVLDYDVEEFILYLRGWE